MQDIAFSDADLNGYSSIPTSAYGTLSQTFVTSVVVNQLGGLVSGGLVPTPAGVYFTWSYPVSDNLYLDAAVGYQFQILAGTFTQAQAQGVAPAPVVYESISNFKTAVAPQDRYIILANGAQGSVSIPNGTLKPGVSYTARIRALVFSEKGSGTLGGQYFKYTGWGTTTFSINTPPAALNLRVNGLSNPVGLPNVGVPEFSFTFSDPDGPQYVYQVQVGTVIGPSFSANIWDSGHIYGGASFGSRDFDVQYAGPVLSPGVTYAWRVGVQDGLVDGGFTSAMDNFKINTPPTVTQLRANGRDLIFGAVPATSNSGVVVSWVATGTQRAFTIDVIELPGNGPPAPPEFTIEEFSSSTTITIPTTFNPRATISVSLKIRDDIEYGPTVTGSFIANAKPVASNFHVDGKANPGDVQTPTPTFSWDFSDTTPGDSQQSYRLQVAFDALFSLVLWDTGVLSGPVSSVPYGSTPAPATPPAPLSHGNYYYARVLVSDGVSNSDYAASFFAVNNRPNPPLLMTPTATSYAGVINVTWVPASPQDIDGDDVTYSLEMTSTRSSDSGWQFLAGPFSSGVSSYMLDTSNIKSGSDYGIRVLANDGFADSDTSLGGVSPVNAAGLGFTILNHPPITPVFLVPSAEQIVAYSMKTEWLEASPADIDGDSVFYLLEITRDATIVPTSWENVGVFGEGTSSAIIDISSFPNGVNYRLRITATDSKGGMGDHNMSAPFTVANTAGVTDFERYAGSLYLGTTDGRVLKGSDAIWQVEQDFTATSTSSDSSEMIGSFQVFSSGSPVVSVVNGSLVIQASPTATFILRQE